ncbi:MAG TPA: glycosyltransferase [Chloroflexota bacterium]|jgi:spore maturation protein CgeB
MTRFAFFYQSVISDWNHGNAHFLRGLMRALQARGHRAVCFEQEDNWSLSNLLRVTPTAIEDFVARFPDVNFIRYPLDLQLDRFLRQQLAEVDVCIVHEWNEPTVIRRLGYICARMGKPAYFHDTHYRVILDDAYRASLGLEHFAGILAYSPSLAERYRALGFQHVSVLHEAADVTVFWPLEVPKMTDVVFVGNYGDGDRSDELEDYVFAPRLSMPGLEYAVYGVRYPADVVTRLNDGLDIDYGGWLPNVVVPSVYSSARVVLHVPRRQYVELLPGTPTIRMFEALACGACLISLPWEDTDHLFEAGADYAIAHSPNEMRELIAEFCSNDAARDALGRHGRQTILDRHTCGHRAEQLLEIVSATHVRKP